MPHAAEAEVKIKAGRLDEVRGRGVTVVKGSPHDIAVFAHDDELFAMDNRCPHLGFPMDRGTVKQGVVTCHWHHWRFDLATGGCFTDGGDDVRVYPVEVRDGEVWVDVAPAPAEEVVAAARRRFGKALEQSNTLAIAKSIIRLTEAGTTAPELMRRVARFGATFRNDWSVGMSILSALGTLLKRVPADRALAVLGLTHADRAVAQANAGKPPRREREALPDRARPGFEALKEKFRLFIDEREAAGAERCLITVLRGGATREQAADLLYSAATDHVYIDEGHPFDYINKAFELLELIGWEAAPEVLPLLVAPLAEAEWYEEQSEWRYPFDFPAALEAIEPVPAAAAGKTWDGEAALVAALQTEHPKELLSALGGAVEAGATKEEMARALGAASAIRMARFNLKNEIFDWENMHHAFTYANAVSEAAQLAPWEPMIRAIYHGAIKLYLVRFLTIPPARLPSELSDQIPDGEPEALLGRMAEAVGTKRVTDAAHALYAYVRGGHDRDRLLTAMLATAAREDMGFHMVQSVEAGMALSRRLAGTPHETVPLVAAIRYVAIHSPTDRFVSSTVDKAIRLERGEDLFLES